MNETTKGQATAGLEDWDSMIDKLERALDNPAKAKRLKAEAYKAVADGGAKDKCYDKKAGVALDYEEALRDEIMAMQRRLDALENK